MAIICDHAVVLRRYPYGESSLVVHVLTREHGRVALLAKGAYRPTSRYFGVLDFGATLELEYSRAPRSDLGLLRAGSVLRTRRGLGAACAQASACSGREPSASGRRVGTLPLAVLDDARSLLASTDDDRQANWTSTRTDLVRDFVGRFLDYHLETRLKSQRAFLAVKNRNAPADTNG